MIFSSPLLSYLLALKTRMARLNSNLVKTNKQRNKGRHAGPLIFSDILSLKFQKQLLAFQIKID